MAVNKNYIAMSSGDIAIAEYTDGSYIQNASDIDYILNAIDSNHVIPQFRIYVLYADETINYEIPNEDIKLGGSYSENYQDGQRRSLSFSLYNESGRYTPNIFTFWAGTRLRLDVGLLLPDDSLIWFQKGIFVINKINPSLVPSEATVSIEAGDKFSLFENKTGTLDSSYEIPVGSDIKSVISGILLMDDGSNTPYDTKEIIYHKDFEGKKTQATISKSAGETLGSILLDLAVQLSAEIFYNSNGNLTLIPTNEVSLDYEKPLMCHYADFDGDMTNLNFNFDLTSIINRIIVMGNNVSGSFVKATAVNDNPSSPLYYKRIGYRTGSVINDTNISSNVLAEERAAYELRKVSIIQTSTSISVLLNPLISVNNLISLTSDFYDLTAERFLVQQISYSLDFSGFMSLTLANLANLPTLTHFIRPGGATI